MHIRSDQAKALGGCAPCKFRDEQADAADRGPKSQPAASVVVVDPAKEHWIGIELVDTQKRPLANQAFIATPPNHEPIRGNLDAHGKVRIEGIDPGNCQIEFPDLDRRDFV